MLYELQKKFKDNLFQKEVNQSLEKVFKLDECWQERFKIYQNHVGKSLKLSIKEKFPICEKVIGANHFNQIVRLYITKNPPHQSSLAFYGESFSDFLSNMDVQINVEYISALADFEWKLHLSYLAKEEPSLDLNRFANMDNYEHIILVPKETVILFKSTWNINEISLGLPAQEKENFSVIYRNNFKVTFEAISSEEYKLIELFKYSFKLQEIVKKMSSHKNFDFEQSLAKLFNLKIFSTYL